MPPSFLSQLITSNGKVEKAEMEAGASNAAPVPEMHHRARGRGMTKPPLTALQVPLPAASAVTSPASSTSSSSNAPLAMSPPSSETQKKLKDFFQRIGDPLEKEDNNKENKLVSIRELRSQNQSDAALVKSSRSSTGSSSSSAASSSGATSSKMQAVEGLFAARAQQAQAARTRATPPTSSERAHPIAAMLSKRVAPSSGASSPPMSSSTATLKKPSNQPEHSSKPSTSAAAHPLAAMLKARQRKDAPSSEKGPGQTTDRQEKNQTEQPNAAPEQKGSQPQDMEKAKATSEDDTVPLKDHSSYAKYFKMLKVGLPAAVVRHKMQSENMDPSILDLDPNQSLASQRKSAAPAPLDDHDPEYQALLKEYNEKCPKYQQMLKIGLPRGAVEHKMRSEGVDPSWLDGPPKRPEKKSDGPTAEEIEAHQQKYQTYFQMLKIGLPRGAVEHKMRMAGIDPAELDGPRPKNASKTQTAAPAKKRPQSIRKKLHWQVKRHETVNDSRESIWNLSIDDEEDREPVQVQISDESKQELEKLFVKAVSDTKKKRPLSGKPGAAGSKAGGGFQKKSSITLIDMKKSQNIAIVLARVKLSYAELKHEILSMNPSVLSTPQIQALMDMWPDQQEQATIDNYHGEMEALGTAEKFLVETRTVPRFREKLDCLRFKQEFSNRVYELRESIHLVIRGVNQVISSQSLKKLFIYILQTGNLLNFGGDTDRAATIGGFSLNSLVKLSQTKAFEGGVTFLRYIVQSVERDLPRLSRFHEEISLISKSSKVALSTLYGEKKALEAGYKSLLHEAETVVGPDADIDLQLASSILKNFALEVQQNLESIQDLLDQMEEAKQHFLEYFEEEDTSEQLDELLGYIANFVEEYKREHQRVLASKKTNKPAVSADAKKLGSQPHAHNKPHASGHHHHGHHQKNHGHPHVQHAHQHGDHHEASLSMPNSNQAPHIHFPHHQSRPLAHTHHHPHQPQDSSKSHDPQQNRRAPALASHFKGVTSTAPWGPTKPPTKPLLDQRNALD